MRIVTNAARDLDPRSSAAVPVSATEGTDLRAHLGLGAGVLAAFCLGIAGAGLMPASQGDLAPEALVLRGELPLSTPVVVGAPPASNVVVEAPHVAVSPDGRRIAYAARAAATTRLVVRDLDGTESRELPGTEGAITPFFSPDGRSIGFLTDRELKTIALDGGLAQTLCEVPEPTIGSWHGDQIFFGATNGHVLLRIAQDGGPARKLATPKEWWIFTDVLPGGEWALAEAFPLGRGATTVAAISTTTGELRPLLSSAFGARYVAPGTLLFGRAGALMSVTFDAEKLRVVGEPRIVATGVTMDWYSGAIQAAASRDVLAYAPGADRSIGRLTSIDREGRVEDLEASPRRYGSLVLDPRGERIAAVVGDVTSDIWIYDLQRREARRFPAAEPAAFPVWSPAGDRLAYTAFNGSPPGRAPWPEAFDAREAVLTVDGGAGPGRRVPADVAVAEDWSPDGRMLALHMTGFVDVETGAQTEFEKKDDAHRTAFDFSPSGRYVAYASNETGRFEVWVRSIPDGGVVRQVSTDGAFEPVWTRSGQLFYRNGNRWLVTTVQERPALSWTPAVPAFEGEFQHYWGRSYDVSPDGQRLYAIRSEMRSPPASLHVVTDWRAIGSGRR